MSKMLLINMSIINKMFILVIFFNHILNENVTTNETKIVMIKIPIPDFDLWKLPNLRFKENTK